MPQEQTSDLMSRPCAACGHVRAAHRHGQTVIGAPVVVGRCCLCDCNVFADENQRVVDSCPPPSTPRATVEQELHDAATAYFWDHQNSAALTRLLTAALTYGVVCAHDGGAL